MLKFFLKWVLNCIDWKIQQVAVVFKKVSGIGSFRYFFYTHLWTQKLEKNWYKTGIICVPTLKFCKLWRKPIQTSIILPIITINCQITGMKNKHESPGPRAAGTTQPPGRHQNWLLHSGSLACRCSSQAGNHCCCCVTRCRAEQGCPAHLPMTARSKLRWQKGISAIYMQNMPQHRLMQILQNLCIFSA